MHRASFDRKRSSVTRAMQVALGVLGWMPEVFWRATPYELMQAVRGWQEKNGWVAGGAPPSETEIAHLKDLLKNQE